MVSETLGEIRKEEKYAKIVAIICSARWWVREREEKKIDTRMDKRVIDEKDRQRATGRYGTTVQRWG